VIIVVFLAFACAIAGDFVVILFVGVINSFVDDVNELRPFAGAKPMSSFLLSGFGSCSATSGSNTDRKMMDQAMTSLIDPIT
jgi:hypothetical protein